MKIFFKQVICSLMILFMTITPFFGLPIKKAQANESLSGYITSLAPVITKLPGCKKAIGSGGGTSDLFGSIKNMFNGKSSKLKKTIGLETVQQNTGQNTIAVSDKTLQNTSEENKAINEDTKKAGESVDKNQNCLNGIGKAIAKILVTKLTDSVVSWIQTGDFGDPFYIQNSGDFFGDIAKNEILQFNLEINDPELFPFGKAFMQNQAKSFNKKFADNAEYSLDKMIADADPGFGFTAQTFNLDFSKGGWDAWNALTQVPANNPLGFQLIASNELQKRLEGTSQSTANQVRDALKEAGGFLGSQQCVDPKGLSKADSDAALAAGEKDGVCKKWIYVTPGKLIGDQLVNAVQKKDNSLMDVETLNDAMAAILDAVLAKFSASLQSEEGLLGTTQSNPYDHNNADGININTNDDYSEGQINGSSWLKQHPDFNIRTDLNQALIDEQRIYRDKIIQQNIQLISINGSDLLDSSDFSLGKTGLIPTIYQLDYCIPGPHAGYEEDAQHNLEAVQNKMGNMNFADMTENGWFKLFDSLSLGILGTVVGLVNSYAFDCGTDAGSQAFNTFLNQFDVMTHMSNGGYYPETNWHGGLSDSGSSNAGFCTAEGFITTTDKVESEYEKIIKRLYNIKYLPSTAKESRSLFSKIPGYVQIIKDNEATIAHLNGAIKQLEKIKGEIDSLNENLASGNISAEDYENGPNGIIPWKNLFARISFSLYSGDDIEAADSLSKEISDLSKHILNDLIQGPTGCEQEIASGQVPTPNVQLFGAVRRDYPMPHLYDYPNRIRDWGYPPRPIEKSFIPFSIFRNGDGAGSVCPNWAMECIELKGFMDTNSPHVGGAAWYWENALDIW